MSISGPLPPAIMDQLAAAAAASYVTQPGPPPGQQQQQQQQPQHQPPPRAPNLVDTAVQTDVTTVVQSKQARVTFLFDMLTFWLLCLSALLYKTFAD